MPRSLLYRRVLAAAALCLSALYTEASLAQTLDQRLLGSWIQTGSGQSLIFSPDGSAVVGFTGQAGAFSGPAQVRPCATGGGNICITKERMDCSYFYAFTGENSMNLQYKDGRPQVACAAANGDYRRRQ
jgi:hypothetical protein